MFSLLWVIVLLSIVGVESREGMYDLSAIKGWFVSCDTVQTFLSFQQAKVPGGLQAVAEIGIHHGKSFICMLDAIPAGVPIVALDLFDELQRFNSGHSGKGSLAPFKKNLRAFYDSHPDKQNQVVIKAADSTKLFAADVLLLTKGKPINFFSVDGCHTADCTLSDLRLAHSVLGTMGVIMVDDYFNSAWPGVRNYAI